MFRHKLIGIGAAALLVLATTIPAQADPSHAVFAYTFGGETKTLDVVTTLGSFTLTALDPVFDGAAGSGWYDQTGFHDDLNPNYIAGICGSDDSCFGDNLDRHNYMVFGGASLGGATILSATLNLTNPSCPSCGYQSANATETFTLWDVTTELFALMAPNVGAVGTYADLGSGVSLGSKVMSAADNGTLVSIALNAAGLAYLSANIETATAFGGAVDTTAPIPEPTTMLLLGSGLVGLAAWKRRQSKNG